MSLNKDAFDIFYEDYIAFKNYVNELLRNNFKPPDNLFTKKIEQLQQKNDGNTTNDLNDKIQSLTNENDTLKQQNQTFQKIIELM